ncbi:MAG: hypothetical protein ABSA54_00095 [Terriglobales bacterium]|jgi:hypothetical protein
MRYAKGSLVINPERDIPLLRQVRNSKFVSHHQLFELMKLGGFDHSRNSFNWRLKRLLDSGHISVCQGVYGAGSAVYRITKDGITLLEHHGQFTAVLHSNTDHLPHLSQVFHSLELNAVQLALARKNLLAGWQSEIEIASFNTISRSPYQKDYDAIVDVWIGDRTVRFALEYERILKSLRQYERIRVALEAERQIGCVLYLTSGMEVLVHLVHEFQSVRKRLAFAGATSFERHLLDTVVTGRDGITARFWDVLQ